MKTTRQRVEKRLRHNQFLLKYKYGNIWDVMEVGGSLGKGKKGKLGWVQDTWPYWIKVYPGAVRSIFCGL